jgi:cytochrome c-type biogenesis protein CcmH
MTEPTPAAAPRPSARLLATLGVAVLAVAVAGYAWRGSPGLRPTPAAQPGAPDAEEQAARQQIQGMVDKLAQRLKDKPDDATGWLMLGRSYIVLGRVDDSIAAYEKAVALRGTDATALADYADALATKNGGAPTTQSDAMVARALAAQPNHLKALALAGSSSFQRADYAGAVRSWGKMAQVLPADSPDMPRLQASLTEARKRAGIAEPASAIAAASTPAAGTAGTTTAAAPSGAAVSGTVTLAPALAAKAAPSDTVFIFARAAQGPRMPLAVMRAQVKDLPITFKLDDSMAMAPSAKISGAAQVIVGARISKSGNAMPQPGDLAGESAPVAPGATGIAIKIAGPAGS